MYALMQRKWPFRLIKPLPSLFFAACSFLPASLLAATITVSNTDDSGSGSLRQAIADAASGDTIDFSVSGTITLSSGELIVDKDLMIDGAGNITIDANHLSRGFVINDGLGTLLTVSLRDLNIVNGYSGSENGGAIYNSGNLGLENVSVTGSTSQNYGGGIYTRHGGTTWAKNCRTRLERSDVDFVAMPWIQLRS